jgi:hypothetical protein
MCQITAYFDIKEAHTKAKPPKTLTLHLLTHTTMTHSTKKGPAEGSKSKAKHTQTHTKPDPKKSQAQKKEILN